MGTTAWLVKARGYERIAQVDDLTQSAVEFVRLGSPGSTLLRFIDPYGYTMFNRLQCIELYDEWNRAADVLLEGAARSWAEGVAALIRRCADEYGYFVRFVGD